MATTQTRLANPLPSTKRGPSNPDEWHRLLQQVLERGHTVGANMTEYKAVMTAAQAEKVLRRKGIITQADILREFPSP